MGFDFGAVGLVGWSVLDGVGGVGVRVGCVGRTVGYREVIVFGRRGSEAILVTQSAANFSSGIFAVIDVEVFPIITAVVVPPFPTPPIELVEFVPPTD